ncbi:hypothetical protein ACJX0J_017332, partial [Zea mays]
ATTTSQFNSLIEDLSLKEIPMMSVNLRGQNSKIWEEIFPNTIKWVQDEVRESLAATTNMWDILEIAQDNRSFLL